MFRPPPADLHDREPLIYTASTTEVWCRSFQTGRDPIFFGKGGAYRWDAPNGDYGVLYLGADAYCAFMESIGRGVLRTRFVSSSQLKHRQLCKMGFSRDLRLIDLVASGGLTRF